MQLGELQSQYNRFVARGVPVIAASVDPVAHSGKMIRRLGLSFIVASDEDQAVQKSYGVQNPETQELALHAVFIVDKDRRIIYRKIAGRRPKSQELLDAIDYYQGNYPMNDVANDYDGTPVAFPRNNFQALIEVADQQPLATTLDLQQLGRIVSMIQARQSDEATIAYRQYMRSVATIHNEAELLAAAAWIARESVGLPEEAMITGRALNQALIRQRGIGDSSKETQKRDDAEADLKRLRGVVVKNENNWRLRSLKTLLRSYRELSFAALRNE